MTEKGKIKLWQWFFLFLIGFLSPVYNILINNSLLALNFQRLYYIFLVILTTVVFSSALFLILNFFRKKTVYEKRMDTAFVLYVLSVSFGSFFNNFTSVFGLFVVPFLIAYFIEMKSVLNDFPRE